MAMEALNSKPGAQVKVIGVGLPRTATNSFCAALEILLHGPAYHASHVLVSDKSHILTFIDILELRPYRTAEDKKKALDLLSKRLDGFVATADPPLSQMIPELMELYPAAKVICTTRDRSAWIESITFTQTVVSFNVFRFACFWLPVVRYAPKFWGLISQLSLETYGVPNWGRENFMMIWDRHHAWLEENVPKEKLVYFDVRDGWEPLCKALDVPEPEGVAFPTVNESKAFEEGFKKLTRKGLLRWAMVTGAVGTACTAAWIFWSRSRR